MRPHASTQLERPYREEAVTLATNVHAPPSSDSTGRAQRNSVLDFTKGMLVLLMILYHWINYFISVQGDFYKYLRFITPSFIFITGFLVASVYLAKYQIGDPRLYKRLLQRGLKLLALFALLNVAESLLFSRHPARATGLQSFLENAGSTFITGNGTSAAFLVLVPISYLLIFASGFLLISRANRCALAAISLALFAVVYLLDRGGLQSAHLELFAIGTLGMVLGQAAPMERIDRVVRHTAGLIAGYGAYLVALNIWGEIYPLQIVGVCFSLMVLYALGVKAGCHGRWQELIALLGRYSLLGYIVQMGLILLLLAGLRGLALGHLAVIPSFVGAFAGTILIIVAVNRARDRSATADKLYRTVFG